MMAFRTPFAAAVAGAALLVVGGLTSAARAAERHRERDCVLTLNPKAGMEHPVGPLAVVGQEEQALRVLIEATHRVKARAVRHESATAIMPLTLMNGLEVLNLSRTGMTKAGVESLRTSLFSCKITADDLRGGVGKKGK